MKLSKNTYLQAFGIITVVLALYRCAVPDVAKNVNDEAVNETDSVMQTENVDTPNVKKVLPDVTNHAILSVARFKDAFPDSQDVHLQSAEALGVAPLAKRSDADKQKGKLVYVGANPYFYVEKLTRSIPYLVPKASTLLNDIGRNYYDSLYVKGVPLHKFIVTSVTRTREDVDRLRERNGNATENSCHLYGTTFDISQNRYQTVEYPGKHCRKVSNDTLKWVLAEVLRDLREEGRCYVKYEVKQGCFHVTVR